MKKFKINYEFKSYPIDTLISDVEAIEEGGGLSFAVETLAEFPVLEAVKSFKKKGNQDNFFFGK